MKHRDANTGLIGLRLEDPERAHEREFLAAVERSRALHRHWVRPPSTRGQYRTWLARIADGSHIGHLLLTPQDELAGVVNISEIVRGAFRSGYLGYYALEPHAGRGFMQRGLQLVIARAFRDYGLHRLEANIQPDNIASRKLVAKLGFSLEGFSPRYLKLGGRWRDHERWAITSEAWRRSGPRSPTPSPPRLRRVA